MFSFCDPEVTNENAALDQYWVLRMNYEIKVILVFIPGFDEMLACNCSDLLIGFVCFSEFRWV